MEHLMIVSTLAWLMGTANTPNRWTHMPADNLAQQDTLHPGRWLVLLTVWLGLGAVIVWRLGGAAGRAQVMHQRQSIHATEVNKLDMLNTGREVHPCQEKKFCDDANHLEHRILINR